MDKLIWLFFILGLSIYTVNSATGCSYLLSRCQNKAKTPTDGNLFCGDGRVDATVLNTTCRNGVCGAKISGPDCYSTSQAETSTAAGVLIAKSKISCLQEQCDDGNNIAGDGCDANCQLEGVSYAYTVSSQSLSYNYTEHVNTWECVYPYPVIDVTTTNWKSFSYIFQINASTAIEERNGFRWDAGAMITQLGTQTTCCSKRVCGNGEINCAFNTSQGIYTKEEECDDSNTASGDGCSSTCSIETGWDCYNGATVVADNTKCNRVPNFLTPVSEVAFLIEWYNHTTGWTVNTGWKAGFESAYSIDWLKCSDIQKNGSKIDCLSVCNYANITSGKWGVNMTKNSIYSCTTENHDLIWVEYGLLEASSVMSKTSIEFVRSTFETYIKNILEISGSTTYNNVTITIGGIRSLTTTNVSTTTSTQGETQTTTLIRNYSIFRFNITSKINSDINIIKNNISDSSIDELWSNTNYTNYIGISYGNLFSVLSDCNQYNYFNPENSTQFISYHKNLCDACCNDICRNDTLLIASALGNSTASTTLRTNCSLINSTLVNNTLCLNNINGIKTNCGIYSSIQQTIPLTQIRIVDYTKVSDPCGKCRSDETCSVWYGLKCGTCEFINGTLTDCSTIFRQIKSNSSESTPPGYIHIIEINMPSNNIIGKLLEYRDPVHMNSLTQIKHLSALTALQNFVLPDNSITMLSTSIDWSKLQSLILIDLRNNKIINVNFMSQMYYLKSLNELLLRNNSLTGEINTYSFASISCYITTIPNSVCYSMNSTTKIDLSFNKIFGEIPLSIGFLSNLISFQIHENNFNVIKSNFQFPISLKLFDLNSNNIITNLPTNLFSCINCQLITIWLQNNYINGTLPNSIGTMKYLTEINLGNNIISGTIPEQIGNLNSLQYFYLQSNKISGEIPATIRFLSNLIDFDISENNILSPLPINSFQYLINLYYFNISSNKLTSLENSFGGLKNLRILDISNNLLTFIPTTLNNLNLLQIFYSHSNNLTSLISISQMTNLRELDLKDNIIFGQLNDTFGNPNLRQIYLQNNKISGSLPPTFTTLTNLRYFDISNNSLQSPIPFNFGALTSLQYLDLSLNDINSVIPTSIGSLTLLTDLQIQNNLFHGSLPTVIGNLRNLKYFHCAENEFSGTLPSELAQLTQLIELSISNNKFTGSLPANLFKLSNLKSLNLSSNSFDNFLPSEAITTTIPSVSLENSGSYWCPFPENSALSSVSCEQCPDDLSANPISLCDGDSECITCSGQGVCNGGKTDGVCNCSTGWTGDGCELLECPSSCSFNVTDSVGLGVGVHGICENTNVNIRCINANVMPFLNISEILFFVNNQTLQPSLTQVIGNYTAEQILFAFSSQNYTTMTNCIEAPTATMSSLSVCSQKVGSIFESATDCWYKTYQISWCNCLTKKWKGAKCELQYIEDSNIINIWVDSTSNLISWTSYLITFCFICLIDFFFLLE
eukprot:c18360_g1_i1.p1 GENE.c18360_g1_i1~~c18360_g1_i1.p1  ORF type:complete len:1460 (+),score=585.27 c18360_g1_i1:101-4480(+)